MQDSDKLVSVIEQEETIGFIKETLARGTHRIKPGPKPRNPYQNDRPVYPDIVRTWKKDYSKARFHTLGTPFWQLHAPSSRPNPNSLIPNVMGNSKEDGKNYIAPREAYGPYKRRLVTDDKGNLVNPDKKEK